MKDEKSVKVLHILKYMQRGGVEQFILNQYKVLSNQSVYFDIALYGPDKHKNDERLIEEFENLGCKIIYLPFPNDHFLFFAKEFSKTMKKYNYDVIHSHQNLFSGVVLSIAKLSNIPKRIAHAHTAKERKKNNAIRKLYTYVMKSLISCSATHFLCASSMAGQFVFKKKTKSEFLPNGIDIKPFLEASKSHVKSELNIEDDAIIIGHVGSFKPSKNHNFLIEIFDAFHKKYSKAHLILVGEGEESACVKQKVDSLNLNDKVHFLGNRNDIAAVINTLDAFLFPSFFEGLGIALIESQAAGVRSIASTNVPRETDIGLKLVSFLPLDKPEEWLKELENYVFSNKETPSAAIRTKCLKEKKFDNISSASRLLDIYTSRN